VGRGATRRHGVSIRGPFFVCARRCAWPPLLRAPAGTRASRGVGDKRHGIWPLVWGSLVCTHFGGLLSIAPNSLSTFLLTVSTSGAARRRATFSRPSFFVATALGDAHFGGLLSIAPNRSCNLVRLRDLVGAPRGRIGLFFRLPGRGGHLGGPATKWGGRGRPAGHAAVPPAVPR
jgi:hypothetical protein